MSKQTSPSQQAEVKQPVVSPEMASRALNLRQRYLSLTKKDQDACIHFFNLHNNAGWIYNELISQEAREYIDLQVAYSQELAIIETSQNVESDEVDQVINGDESL